MVEISGRQAIGCLILAEIVERNRERIAARWCRQKTGRAELRVLRRVVVPGESTDDVAWIHGHHLPRLEGLQKHLAAGTLAVQFFFRLPAPTEAKRGATVMRLH